MCACRREREREIVVLSDSTELDDNRLFEKYWLQEVKFLLDFFILDFYPENFNALFCVKIINRKIS